MISRLHRDLRALTFLEARAWAIGGSKKDTKKGNSGAGKDDTLVRDTSLERHLYGKTRRGPTGKTSEPRARGLGVRAWRFGTWSGILGLMDLLCWDADNPRGFPYQ